jgi:hypothetical protein
VLEARDPKSGYRLYHRHRPDVVIVDLAMQGGGLSGLDVIPSNAAGIFLTRHGTISWSTPLQFAPSGWRNGKQSSDREVATDAYLGSRSQQITFLALRHALPTVMGTREYAAAGILMTYGNNQTDSYRQVGLYVGRILKGEKPASIPVIQPTKFDLVINLTTAKALGLKIPESFLLRADELID